MMLALSHGAVLALSNICWAGNFRDTKALICLALRARSWPMLYLLELNANCQGGLILSSGLISSGGEVGHSLIRHFMIASIVPVTTYAVHSCEYIIMP